MPKMWQKCVRFLWLANLILAGCVSETTVPPSNTTTVEKPTESSHEVISVPLTRWVLGTDMVVTKGDFTFALHVLEISPRYTVIVYSTSGVGSKQFAMGKGMQLVDQNGQQSELLQTTSLAELDGLYFGTLTFAARQPDATELHLVIQPDNTGEAPLDILAAQVYSPKSEINPPSPSSFYYMVGGQNYREQASFKISYNCWGLCKDDRIATTTADTGMTMEEMDKLSTEVPLSTPITTQISSPNYDNPRDQPLPTPSPVMLVITYPPYPPMPPTPGPSPTLRPLPYPPMPTGTPPWLLPTATQVPPNPIAEELAGGKMILGQTTLRIENTKSSQVYYLYILFLEDGEVKSTVLQ